MVLTGYPDVVTLKEWRARERITQEEAGKRIGISRALVVAIEGRSSIAFETARLVYVATRGAVRYCDLTARDDTPELLHQAEQAERSLRTLPLLGSIAAGIPIKAQSSIDGEVEVPSSWTGSRPCFTLKVTGESMIEACIMPGDVVVVRELQPGEQPPDGDIVVATVEGETTLKRFRLRRGRPELVPENKKMKPIIITEVQGEVVLQGVVVGLMRSYHRTTSSRGP
jgi:repressor LexA